MSRRSRISRRISKRLFTKTASRTRKRNVIRAMRGGYRA